MSGKCFATVRSRKCSSVVLCSDFVSTSCDRRQHVYYEPYSQTYLVDTADTEPKRTSLDTGAVHVVSNEQDELRAQSSDALCDSYALLTLNNSLKCFASSSDLPASDSFRALCKRLMSATRPRASKTHIIE